MSKKPRGHFCKICHQRKANEKFSGRGHAAHICKACAKRGNKPPEIEFEAPVFIYEDFIDDENYLFGGSDFFFTDEVQPPPTKKRSRKPDKAKQLRAEQKKTAKTFLSKILANGEVSAEVIREAANKASIPKEALHRAKGSLSIRAFPTENGSVWRLPGQNKKTEAIT